MMENNMNMDELEQMRQQIQNLKGQINDLARVNDDLLFKSVVDNTRRIRFRVLMSGIGAIAANFIWIKLANDSFVSFPFILFTCGMLLFSIFASLSFNHWQTPTRGENMMKLANELERKMYRLDKLIGKIKNKSYKGELPHREHGWYLPNKD